MSSQVAIVILTKDNPKLLKKCLSSIIKYTSVLFKIYIVDTGSSNKNLQKYVKVLKNKFTAKNCAMLQVEHYHFAENYNNIITNNVNEEWVVLCNDDIELKTPCIDAMLDQARQIKNIGTVGCRLVFPDNTIQHAGQVAYIDSTGLLQCTHRGYKETGKYPSTAVVGNTAALMLISRDIFIENGMFDEIYTECWEDIQFNMRLILSGYVNYYMDNVYAIHHESMTRTKDEKAIFRLRYDYTYKLKPWFDSLDTHQQRSILKYGI